MSSDQRISDFKTLVNSNYEAIRARGDEAWDQVNRAQSEPLIIADFLRNQNAGPHYLNQHLPSLFSQSGYDVKFASVLVHQKPYVHGIKLKGGPKTLASCELGDLHLLFAYLGADKELLDCRSIIFQAKKAPLTGDHVIPTGEQRELYDACWGFQYRYKSFADQAQRILPPNGTAARARSLQYLFCGQQPVVARTTPSKIDKGYNLNFGDLICRVMNDSSGYVVARHETNSKSWSRINWDLINWICGASARDASRGCNIQDLVNCFNDFDEFEHYKEERIERGIPMMLIIVHDRGEEHAKWLKHLARIQRERMSGASIE